MNKVSEVVVLVLLEGSEEKVQDLFTISPRTLPLLLLLLLMLSLCGRKTRKGGREGGRGEGGREGGREEGRGEGGEGGRGEDPQGEGGREDG